jgi:hypothetical protein
MRYVCFKTVLSRIIDEQVNDLETIKAILQSFKEKEITCGIRVKNDPTYTYCRILEVGENEFRFWIVKPDSSLKRYARYKDLEYLELKTDDEVIATLKPNANRWILLDIDGSDEMRTDNDLPQPPSGGNPRS